VAEVKDVTVAAARLGEHPPGLALGPPATARAAPWVEIALDAEPGPDALPRLVERQAPVDRDGVAAGYRHALQRWEQPVPK